MLSSEPAPSPRPWASARARPLADESTVTPAPQLYPVKADISTLLRIGHFYFALTTERNPLHRLEERVLITSFWGTSKNNRKVTPLTVFDFVKGNPASLPSCLVSRC